MRSRKGFTLIELMVVVLIVAVLAAVIVPLLRSRVEAAKWSEGKAGAGTIATAIRAYSAEKGNEGTYPPDITDDLRFTAGDLRGKYFEIGDYDITACAYNEAADPALTFTIEVSAPDTNWNIQTVTLNDEGTWVESE